VSNFRTYDEIEYQNALNNVKHNMQELGQRFNEKMFLKVTREQGVHVAEILAYRVMGTYRLMLKQKKQTKRKRRI